jgi:hypothetical protein
MLWKNPMKKVSNFIDQLAVDNRKSRDTGMAATLIMLLLEWFTGNGLYFKIAIALLVITMIAPTLYKPLAYIWFGLAHILGNLVSRVLLTIVFLLVVFPVGMLRKLFGKDPLKLKNWKQGTVSVLQTRNHIYSSADIEKPY